MSIQSRKAHVNLICSGMKCIELDRENEAAGEVSFGTKQYSEETPKVLVSDLSGWLRPSSSLRGRNGISNSTTKYKVLLFNLLEEDMANAIAGTVQLHLPSMCARTRDIVLKKDYFFVEGLAGIVSSSGGKRLFEMRLTRK